MTPKQPPSSDAWDEGYSCGYAGYSFLTCPYAGWEKLKWMRGWEAGKNQRAKESKK